MNVLEAGFSIPAPDAHMIPGATWSGEAAPKAQVLIAHGRSEYGRRYRHLAEALVRAGYTVHAVDHRGHGAAALQNGTAGDFGRRGFAAVVDDLAIAARFVRQRAAGLPLMLFGHSMGSFACQYFLLDHSELIDGMVLSGSSALDLRNPKHAGSKATDFLAGITNPRTPADWLSRDPAVVDAYLADPLCAFELNAESRASMYADAERTADPSAYSSVRRQLPITLITGDRDPVNFFLEWFEPLAARYRKLGFSDVSTYVYGGARHEPINEINREEVIANLIAWFDRVTKSHCDHAAPRDLRS